VHKKKVHPNDITLYGNSLGASVVAGMGRKLSRIPYKPRSIVMQSGFSSLSNPVRDIIPRPACHIIHNNFDTLKYMSDIGSDILILLIHSQDDEMIHIKHMYLINRRNSHTEYNVISGSHNDPVMSEECIKMIESYM
jgi:fermentation-respiration switch protein FrsA (DUF1100 family)